MFDSLLQDVRYALRSLRHRPIVAAAVVASLALGIGINTAIFSVFERLVLRRLPVPAAGELVLLSSPGPRPGGTSTGDSGPREQTFSYPLFRDLERLRIPSLSPIAAHRDFAANVAHDGHTARLSGLLVSGSYFPVLGVRPALGRLLTADDDRAGAAPVAVLTHRYWLTAFSGDPAVIGRSLVVNAAPITIVGVAAEGFGGTTGMDTPVLFVPLAMADRLRAGSLERTNHWLYLFARLSSPGTRTQVEAALNGPFAALLRDADLPAVQAQLAPRLRAQYLARRIVVVDGSRYRSANRDEARVIVGLLLAVTALVLLIACANVSNLFLARGAERATELGIRVSLGASASRIVRMLLIEATLLGVVGAAVAIGLAAIGTNLLLAMLPADDRLALGFELNRTVLLFTAALGIGSGALFGLVPAWQGARGRAVSGWTAAASRASATSRATRLRTVLITAQIAVATVLVAEAALFTVSLSHVAREALGFDRTGVITFRLSPYLNGYTGADAHRILERVTDELRRTPGVHAVSVSTNPLLSDSAWTQNVTVAQPGDRGVTGPASATRIGDDYFRTLGIGVRAGREFSRDDAAGAPQVAVVNEAFVRRFNLGLEPLGRRLALGDGNGGAPAITIVGVVNDAKYNRVRDAAPPQLFLPYRQAPVGPLSFYVKTLDPRALLAAVPRVVARLDPNLPVERLRPLDDQVWENLTGDRIMATLSSGFAALALLLAGVGLYGVLSYMVAQRRKEIGVRMALGATASDIRRLLFRHIARVAGFGLLAGTALAAGLGRVGQALLFELRGDDPMIIAGAAVSIAAFVVATCVPAARRATRVDPMVALRAE